MDHQSQDYKLRQALRLIKHHIGEEETRQNRELHQAVQLIVSVAREHGLLMPEASRG